MIDENVMDIYHKCSDDNILAWDSEIGGGVTPPGEYRCRVVSANTDNKNMINIKLMISNGQYEGRFLYYRIFRTKYGNYNQYQLTEVAKASGIPNGTSFNTLEEYLIAIENSSVIAVVVHSIGKGQHEGRVFANVSRVMPV